MIRLFKSLCVCSALSFVAVCVSADEPSITWPAGWQVEALPAASEKVARQRAVKTDADGNQVMVMELTMTEVEKDHQVNLPGVLLEMRKSIQKDFFQSGYQSVCNKVRAATLGSLSALETTCTITENGRHVLSQTLVAAVQADKAYVLSYAGQAEVYKASADEIVAVRNSLKL
ncbi:DUF4946 domain-containing protein [Pseudomonas granadensis]|uniref:DUF4946 domain-containing protein n=1 Tax=Pseudomonas granadensis TaxID=1421430 RepID=A0ABX7G8R3_9PSED|nr:DUF4946 domain-containing protein [Pseudomonas granadensis]MBN6774394.1 DUF4946 domain-containing protein [Pseudomonas granadensis]MBN6805132.1 DUF4946 domain-containing protein [Pseudomonas granadensis]MBN6832420.1 DUF4946 domain-containing protein [Pseudomonas granadensis]MBN6839326.1 DUF4946 domain-containing protein [Pseudomonas granadensis]MBN6868843.1 DUF4946 domain-containing protein [Pseudomonas granadensis]